MKKLLSGSIVAALISITLIAQGSGTPSTLRVLTDSAGSLLVSSSALTGAQTSSVFSNTRLKTDASGNLVITDGSGAGFAPANATYVTQTANAGLSAEQAIGALSSGILRGATTTGVITSLGDVLPAVNGGTGLSAGAVGDLIFVNAVTPTFARLAAVATGQVLVSAGVNTAPAYSASPTVTTLTATNLISGAGAVGTPSIIVGTTNTGLWRSATNEIAISANAAEVVRFTQGGTLFSTGPVLISAGNSYTAASTFLTRTAPTTPVACTSPTVTWSNGTVTFQIDVGSACAASTLSWTMPAATNGWMCDGVNLSNPATSSVSQSAGTTTSVTLTNYARTTGLAAAWTAGDDIRVKCLGG